MKSLVIAEKPSVGRDIARVLHCSKNIPGALEGDKYIVTWALGHLVTLADPEEYDKKYSKWDMETLPMMPEKMQLVVIRQTAKQYGLVKKQLFRKDVNQIIIATDAGREGAGGNQADRKTVFRCKGSAFPKGDRRDYHCNRCRKRGRAGSTLDPGKIRMQKADQTSVDLLSHRQSHPRRICKPA